MMRRQFIALIGGGLVFAAAGATAFVSTRTPEKALAPWRHAGSDDTDIRKFALSYAILAPNRTTASHGWSTSGSRARLCSMSIPEDAATDGSAEPANYNWSGLLY